MSKVEQETYETRPKKTRHRVSGVVENPSIRATHKRDSRPVERIRTTLAAVHARSQTLKHRRTSHGHLIRQLGAACCTLSSLGRDLRLTRTDQGVIEDLGRRSAR